MFVSSGYAGVAAYFRYDQCYNSTQWRTNNYFVVVFAAYWLFADLQILHRSFCDIKTIAVPSLHKSVCLNVSWRDDPQFVEQ